MTDDELDVRKVLGIDEKPRGWNDGAQALLNQALEAGCEARRTAVRSALHSDINSEGAVKLSESSNEYNKQFRELIGVLKDDFPVFDANKIWKHILEITQDEIEELRAQLGPNADLPWGQHPSNT